MYSCQHRCDAFLIQPPEDSGQEQTESNSISLGWGREMWHQPSSRCRDGERGRAAERRWNGGGCWNFSVGVRDKPVRTERLSPNFICDYSVTRRGMSRDRSVPGTGQQMCGERNWCWMVLSHLQGSRLNSVRARPGTLVVLHFEPCSETLAMFGQN